MRQIILDTETTGLETKEGHRIIEIGCIEIVNRRRTEKTYHQYINPQREMDPEALAVHGITSEFLENKPVFADIVESFLEFIQGAELIIHNAPFDVGFINYELSLLPAYSKRTVLDYCSILDTLVLARRLHTGQRNSLDVLCKRYSIDNSRREYHGALLDADLLAQLYLAMTGGQVSLFEEQVHDETRTGSDKKIIASKVMNTLTKQRVLPIRKATSEELALHEKHLRELFPQGNGMWLEEEK